MGYYNNKKLSLIHIYTVNILVKALGAAWESPDSFGQYYLFVPLFVIIFLAIIWVIVFMNDAERRIPVQYAKRVVGRKTVSYTHLDVYKRQAHHNRSDKFIVRRRNGKKGVRKGA